MGIFCEINLFKPLDGVYQPGQNVSGIIKYGIDEPTEFEKIIISLKGSGLVRLRIHRNKSEKISRGTEVYVDMDEVVQDRATRAAVGMYEVKFNFKLPHDLPSSLDFYKRLARYRIKCTIKYYIRIKFERRGLFALNKHFRKEITVISGGTPRLLREPLIYGETKKLMQLFSSKDNIVNMKATIDNSVIPIGGKIHVHYEVDNKSNVQVKSVETKLIQEYKFRTTGYHEVQYETDVPNTDCKTPSINQGDSQSMPIEINVPSDYHSLENSAIVLRNYYVKIEAELPFPHRNAVVNIPVQIGAIDLGREMTEYINDNDPPPTYWEAMGETKKEENDDNDDESGDDENIYEKSDK